MSHPGLKLDGLSAHQEDRWKNIDPADLKMALREGAVVVARMFAPIYILAIIAGFCIWFANFNVDTCSGKQTQRAYPTVSDTIHRLFPGDYQAALDYAEKMNDAPLSSIGFGQEFKLPKSCR